MFMAVLNYLRGESKAETFDAKIPDDKQLANLRYALRENAAKETPLVMGRDTSFVGEGIAEDYATADAEVISQIKSVPTHY